MAVNKPTGDKARKGAVKKRAQLKNPLTKTSTKRNKKGGQFMAVKKSAKKFKRVRREKAAYREVQDIPKPALSKLRGQDASDW